MIPENNISDSKEKDSAEPKDWDGEKLSLSSKITGSGRLILGFLCQGLSKRMIFPGIGNDDFEDSQIHSKNITI